MEWVRIGITTYYLNVYNPMIYPINGYKMWPKSGFTLVLPPLERRKPGRPAKLRVRDPDEYVNPKNPPSWERLVKTQSVVRGVTNMATIGEHALLLWKRALKMLLEKRVMAARVWPSRLTPLQTLHKLHRLHIWSSLQPLKSPSLKKFRSLPLSLQCTQ